MLAAGRGGKLRHARALLAPPLPARCIPAPQSQPGRGGDGKRERGRCCLSLIDKELLGRGAVAVPSLAGHTPQTPLSRYVKICGMQLNSEVLTQGRPRRSRAGHGEEVACLQPSRPSEAEQAVPLQSLGNSANARNKAA